MKNYLIVILIILFSRGTINSQNIHYNKRVTMGADRLITEYLYLLKGKRIGIVTNRTGLLSNGKYLVDSLYNIKGLRITALFGPEHGIRGNAPAGKSISSGVDPKTKIPIYSLYGKNKKPTPEMLKNVDLLLYDIQDVGARFYTYISTLYYVLQAAAENHIPVIVLDRPDPINGITIDGPIRQKDLRSFVGIVPIPIRYGMTPGELAQMYVGEGWLREKTKPNLTVIKMKNWKRNYYYDNFKLQWVAPSPNIPDLETAIVYPGACLIEGTNISEGRGTHHPFLTIGAPFINSNKLIQELMKLKIKGVEFEPINFIPVNIPTMSSNPKYKDIKCNGIFIKITDRKKFRSVRFGIKLVYAIHKLYPNKFKFRNKDFDLLSGDKKIREDILNNKHPDFIFNNWKNGLKSFIHKRKKYLLY
ncbi:MAG TPA: DUF1343 domain-containing protein [Ignavibacteria bacterium]|nr:DUF1343 domain-containing protein [Ignavibacteria bacterium]